MKTILSRFTHALIVAASVIAFADLSVRAEEKVESQFAQTIKFELGASGFRAGDNITITSVRGSRNHIESGGDYLVEGTYTLATAENAELGVHCTSRGPGGHSTVTPG